jgi:hypothetical protein
MFFQLEAAARRNDLATVEKCLAPDAATNKLDTRGPQFARVFQQAIRNDCESVVRRLCTHLGHNGRFALVAPCLIVKTRRTGDTFERQITPIEYAAECGSEKTVNFILECGENVEYFDLYFDLSAAMQVACRRGHISVVKRLLKANVSVNCGDHDDPDYTAIHYARTGGRWRVAKLLVQRGARVGYRLSWGQYLSEKVSECVRARWLAQMTRVADKQREKRMRKKRRSSNATTLAQKR